jgi:NADP-dependent 3-hydroxy acid dehydrogenase YdfG
LRPDATHATVAQVAGGEAAKKIEENQTMKNDQKVLLITGASSGIGAATAREASEAGWQLALAARSTEKLHALAAEIGTEKAAVFDVDVTDYAAQEKMVARVLERFGRIDAVFANAGVGGQPGGFSGAPIDAWQSIVSVNILGVAYTLRATLSALKAARGHVVITGSVAGRRTLAGSMYSASKWAVSAIGYGLREELRGTGVRVTLIEPGMVDTPFFDSPKPDALKPDDVARSVLYALSQPDSVDVHEIMVLPTPPIETSD